MQSINKNIILNLWILFLATQLSAQSLKDTAQNKSKGMILKSANPLMTLSQTDAPKPQNTLQKQEEKISESILVGHSKLYEQSETTVLFQSGEFQLSAKNQKHLQLLISEIQRDIKQYKAEFENEKIIVLIDVKGFSDDKPFYPYQDENERKEQNKLLSSKRAEIVGKFIQENIEDTAHEVEFSFVGMGEELPHLKTKSYTTTDKRRMCTVYTLVYSEANVLTDNLYDFSWK